LERLHSPYPAAASNPDTMQLRELGSELDQLKRRITRLHRRVRRHAASAEWARCPAQLAERIRSLPAHDLAGWSVKYQAVLWELFEHEPSPSISEQQLRLMKGLGRELRAAT
jgi:hypothetical protein